MEQSQYVNEIWVNCKIIYKSCTVCIFTFFPFIFIAGG